jgi:hypothetical protein
MNKTNSTLPSFKTWSCSRDSMVKVLIKVSLFWLYVRWFWWRWWIREWIRRERLWFEEERFAWSIDHANLQWNILIPRGLKATKLDVIVLWMTWLFCWKRLRGKQKVSHRLKLRWPSRTITSSFAHDLCKPFLPKPQPFSSNSFSYSSPSPKSPHIQPKHHLNKNSHHDVSATTSSFKRR